jgi:3-polyprenyl-4-hydroxybenzoate decarboxylase
MNSCIFDDDVDIFDESEALWAIGTRSQWDKDMVIVPNCASAGLDSSSERKGSGQEEASIAPSLPRRRFSSKGPTSPKEIMDQVSLEDYLPKERI